MLRSTSLIYFVLSIITLLIIIGCNKHPEQEIEESVLKTEDYFNQSKGIDCIAKYKITQDEVIRTLPVEFEYQYKNFILHGHPTNHCEIVICWDLGMSPDNQDLENTDFNWLLFSKKSSLIPRLLSANLFFSILD